MGIVVVWYLRAGSIPVPFRRRPPTRTAVVTEHHHSAHAVWDINRRGGAARISGAGEWKSSRSGEREPSAMLARGSDPSELSALSRRDRARGAKPPGTPKDQRPKDSIRGPPRTGHTRLALTFSRKVRTLPSSRFTFSRRTALKAHWKGPAMIAGPTPRPQTTRARRGSRHSVPASFVRDGRLLHTKCAAHRDRACDCRAPLVLGGQPPVAGRRLARRRSY